MKVRFHIAGVISVLIGLGGVFLSLLWDVIYKGGSFSMSAIGPYKLIGVAAGVAVLMVGIIIGLLLGRRMPSRADANGMPGTAIAYKLTGFLLILGGLGGTLLSLLWDVIRRGRPFSVGAIGPLKMMGAAAGIVLLATGIVMMFFLARKKQAAPKPKEEPAQTAAGGAQPAMPAQAVADAMQPGQISQQPDAYAP